MNWPEQVFSTEGDNSFNKITTALTEKLMKICHEQCYVDTGVVIATK